MGGGLLGVGVFFTLSGYLITSILLWAWDSKRSLGLNMFWIRRARRLLPAVILLLLVVLIATALVRPEKLGEWSTQALAALFYVANWATIAKGDTYFNRFEGPSPIEHLWSLSVEEQFYVLWPLLLLAMLKIFRGNYKFMAAVTFLLGVASMIELAVLFDPSADATRVYEGTDTRAGGLLWGAALAMLWHPKIAQKVTDRSWLVALDVCGALGLIGILALAAFTTETSSFLYHGGIALLTVVTCMTLAAAAHPETMVARLLALAPLRWLGERTYGIYLWHMPVAAFLPEHTFYGNTWLRAAIVIALTLVLASLSWTIIEDPIRKYGLVGAWKAGTAPVRQGGARRLVPPFIAAGALVTVGAVGAMAAVSKLPQTSVQQIAKDEAKKEAATAPPAPKAPVAHPTKKGPLATSCTSVAHIGDSTSLGLSDTDQTELTNPAQRIRAQYAKVGVRKTVEDIRGARAIFEHFKGDLNGQEAVQAQAAKGFSGCYVIALGMNDAATMALGGSGADAASRIDMVMKATQGKPVLWVNTITQAWANLPGYQNVNMKKFNAALVEATERYPNLRIYDWASEALPHPEWFMQNDANHNNALGSRMKAVSIAHALAIACPKGSEPSSARIVASK